jgi:hypothetical protein
MGVDHGVVLRSDHVGLRNREGRTMRVTEHSTHRPDGAAASRVVRKPVPLLRAAIVFAAAVMTLTTSTAEAQGPGWTANSTVVKLVVTHNGGINVRLSPDLSNCVSQSGYGPLYASVYPNHPGIDRIKADLLVAFTTGTPVSLYLSDENCTVQEIILGGH